ncbi:MAG: nucleotidyltransferase [Ignavibacteria bacterium GWA2_35_9]|nr:MAG: nucleotidyltransferase [Ignavibacteria bacterium GWA2_35_9]OGU47293.1 MAG: nucleotidyltransferase [Ignavibacteria bacterium GWB2_36_8]OGU52082.1 MAG: nucleotidyltransferase [Ignavibacteria bacterium GWC2_36_12]OGV07260.1 MAG: nucleotidyltransferase [Ignavibacteria bacterium RIFOXYA2_FULL_37_17]
MSRDLKEQIKKFFKSKPVLRAYLFGSEARNESEGNSDIDILVELDYSKPIGLEFVKMKLELEELLNKKVDLLSSGGISKYIQPFIEQDKILIYEK